MAVISNFKVLKRKNAKKKFEAPCFAQVDPRVHSVASYFFETTALTFVSSVAPAN